MRSINEDAQSETMGVNFTEIFTFLRKCLLKKTIHYKIFQYTRATEHTHAHTHSHTHSHALPSDNVIVIERNSAFEGSQRSS